MVLAGRQSKPGPKVNSYVRLMSSQTLFALKAIPMLRERAMRLFRFP